MILSTVFLKGKTTFKQKTSILLSVLGVIYIFVMKGAYIDFTKILGILLILLSCLSGAGYSVLARTTLKEYSVTKVSFMMILMGFVFFNAMAIFNHFHKGPFINF